MEMLFEKGSSVDSQLPVIYLASAMLIVSNIAQETWGFHRFYFASQMSMLSIKQSWGKDIFGVKQLRSFMLILYLVLLNV